MRRGKRTLYSFILSVLLALSACASVQNPVSESPGYESGAEFSVAAARDAQSDGTKTIRLGSSPYALRISREFSSLRVSNEDWENDMVAAYHNGDKLLDFAVYQFSKEGYPDTLKEFVEEEAAEYEASEIETDEAVNGIPIGYYRSMDNYGGVYRNGVTYALENDDEYIEVDFWFIGYQAEEEARKIISTLTVLESETLSLGGYQIRVPEDFSLVSGADANPAVYASGNDFLRLYVTRFPAGGMSLTEFARSEALRKGGSNMETDAKINGIPAASYCAVEATDGAFHSTLTYVLEDDGGFMALTFRLDGITAEAETENILDTLSAP
ncbi:MAG: hypothetical protein IJQ81_12410 [Oscillibacter sp.]|nr:hypothetical protein [Oscillibacter sp.]